MDLLDIILIPGIVRATKVRCAKVGRLHPLHDKHHLYNNNNRTVMCLYARIYRLSNARRRHTSIAYNPCILALKTVKSKRPEMGRVRNNWLLINSDSTSIPILNPDQKTKTSDPASNPPVSEAG